MQIQLKSAIAVSNLMMAAGLLPYLVVFGFIVWTSGYRGDAAMNALFMSVFGLGVSSVITLIIALPGFLWSRSLIKFPGGETRSARVLRRAVIVGLVPVPVVFMLMFKP